MENSAFPRAKAARLSLSTLLGAMAFAAFPLDSDARQKKAAPVAAPMDLAQPASAMPWSRYSGWPATDWKDYNTLANLASPAYAPPPKLEGPIAGDPKNGEKLAFDRSRGGSCVACHIMGKPPPRCRAVSAPTCPRSAPGDGPTSGCSIMCTTRAASTRIP